MDIHELSPEARERLAAYYVARHTYEQACLPLHQMRVQQLEYGTYTDEQIADYAERFVAPTRHELDRCQEAMFKDVVNIEGLKEMLPMIVSAFTQYVNVPLFLELTTIDADRIMRYVNALKAYIQS